MTNAGRGGTSWASGLVLPVVVAFIGCLAVIQSARIANNGIKESSTLQAASAREDRVWNGRLSAYNDLIVALTQRRTLAVRLSKFEENPTVPGAVGERLAILGQMRSTEPTLDAAVDRGRLLGGPDVRRALADLGTSLNDVVTSKSGFGAGVGCTQLFPGATFLELCGRFVDNSAPLDEQALATPLIEEGELVALAHAIDNLVNAAAKEIARG